MKTIRMMIIGIMLLTSGGCFPVFVPVHDGHGGYHHDHDHYDHDRYGGDHGDRR